MSALLIICPNIVIVLSIYYRQYGRSGRVILKSYALRLVLRAAHVTKAVSAGCLLLFARKKISGSDFFLNGGGSVEAILKPSTPNQSKYHHASSGMRGIGSVNTGWPSESSGTAMLTVDMVVCKKTFG